MQVLHVNRALPQRVIIDAVEVTTGIHKLETTEPVRVHTLGLEGDGQADLKVHGGLYQAVYAYPGEHYPHWERELGLPLLPPGAFGENLTLSGMLESETRIGDVHRIGGTVLQVTSPRIPCFKLGHRLDRPGMLKAFLRSGYSGFYYRVLEEGMLAAGAPVEILSRDPQEVTVRALLGLYRLGEGGPELIGRALRISSLPPPVRSDLENRLRKR